MKQFRLNCYLVYLKHENSAGRTRQRNRMTPDILQTCFSRHHSISTDETHSASSLYILEYHVFAIGTVAESNRHPPTANSLLWKNFPLTSTTTSSTQPTSSQSNAPSTPIPTLPYRSYNNDPSLTIPMNSTNLSPNTPFPTPAIPSPVSGPPPLPNNAPPPGSGPFPCAVSTTSAHPPPTAPFPLRTPPVDSRCRR